MKGSLNHDNLSDEVIFNICRAKKVANNAWSTIITKINDARKLAAVTPEELCSQKYKLLHIELQVIIIIHNQYPKKITKVIQNIKYEK